MVSINNFYFTTETYNGKYIGKNLYFSFGTSSGIGMAYL
jgi:hypothetical protein